MHFYKLRTLDKCKQHVYTSPVGYQRSCSTQLVHLLQAQMTLSNDKGDVNDLYYTTHAIYYAMSMLRPINHYPKSIHPEIATIGRNATHPFSVREQWQL